MVRVAVETSESQVEVELVPAVEIPTCWPEKARWPRCLKRWPSQEKVRCIKVKSVKNTLNSGMEFTCQVSDSVFPKEELHGDGLEDVFSKERSNVSKYSVRFYLDFVLCPLTVVNSIKKKF